MKRLVVLLALPVLLLISACESDDHKNDPSHPDIVLIGSEIEGIYLARAAKEEGLSVVILDPRDKPGGQLLQGQMIFLDEAEDDSRTTLLQGRVKGLFDDFKSGKIRKLGEFEAYYHSLLNDIPLESGVTITDVRIAADAKTSKRSVNAIAYRTKDGQEKTISAKYVVENTDFAAISSRLGLRRIPGIESVFGGTKDYMAATVMMRFKGVDWTAFKDGVYRQNPTDIEAKYGPTTTVTDTFTWGFGDVGIRYKPSDKQLYLRGLNTINLRDGEAAINALLVYNVDPTSDRSVQEALEKGKRETPLVLEHLRKELPGWQNAEVNGYPDYLYIRDFDRFETEYVMLASDMMSGRMFWDNVSVAGYPLDLQATQSHPQAMRKGDPDKYGMPLRSFIPKGYDNVILAGKNVGATGAAFGSARIQPNTSIAAEVIGIILGQINGKYGLTEINESRMKKLDAIVSKKGIALTGAAGKNKIADYSESELQQLNFGPKLVR